MVITLLQILKTGQDRTTQLLGLKMSFVVAFEKIKELKIEIKLRQTIFNKGM